MTRDEMDETKRKAAEAVRRGGELREVAERFGISMPTLLDARKEYAPRTVGRVSPEERSARAGSPPVGQVRMTARDGKTRYRYPWERWLGQPRTILVRGRDYSCTTWGMAQQVRQQVHKRGIRGFSVRVTQDTVTIELRREHGR